MDFAIETQPFVQILHDSDRNHWVTISNVGSSEPENVDVYDSLFSYSSPCIYSQMASLLHTSQPEFTLNFLDVYIDKTIVEFLLLHLLHYAWVVSQESLFSNRENCVSIC